MVLLVALGLIVSGAAAAGAAKVVFKGATVTANAGGAGVAITVNVSCTGAKKYSAHVWLASKDGNNDTFFDRTITGTVAKNKGTGKTQYNGQVPANGFIVAGSNVFCWEADKSQGVGYRDLFVAYCAARGACKATVGRP
ncbi:MAG: hypothetical protein WD689_07015 [Gaiellaceae bacterium]